MSPTYPVKGPDGVWRVPPASLQECEHARPLSLADDKKLTTWLRNHGPTADRRPYLKGVKQRQKTAKKGVQDGRRGSRDKEMVSE